MPAQDPVPPEDMTITSVTTSNGTFTASTSPWTINMNPGNYPYYPNQYVPPIMAPGPQVYPFYVETQEPPLTEERLRQIIREELSAYFDEGNDVLAPSPPVEDSAQKIRDAIHQYQGSPISHRLLYGDPLPFPEDDTQS